MRGLKRGFQLEHFNVLFGTKLIEIILPAESPVIAAYRLEDGTGRRCGSVAARGTLGVMTSAGTRGNVAARAA